MKRILSAFLCVILLCACLSAGAQNYVTLRPGSRGPDVIKLQEALRAAGYDIKVDGLYGKGTSQAVSQYQRSKGLKQDGIAGTMTLSTLYTGSAPPSEQPSTGGSTPSGGSYTTLRYGMRGSEVRAMQEALVAKGHSLTPDGVYGRQTRLAVRAFQSANGLKVDGVAGSQTLARLMGTGTAAPGTGTLPPSPQPEGTATVAKALRKGSDPAQIRLLQQALGLAGAGTLTADGVYGGKTTQAVRAFQGSYGLPVNGTADPNTLALLYKVSGLKNDALLRTAINNATGALTLRGAASTAASAVQSVPAGGAMTLLLEQEGWSLVSYKHKSGYVQSAALKLLEAPSPVTNLARGFEQGAYAATGNAKADLLGLAFTQLGFSGGSGTKRILDGKGPGGPYSKYGDAYSDPGESYCSYFISWSARQAQLPATVINDARDVDGLFYDAQQAFVYFFEPRPAQVQAQKLSPASKVSRASYIPQVGDLIYYRWDDAKASTTFSHIGIVYEVSGDLVYTLEGAVGGSVDTRLHRLDNPSIVGYARPKY